MKMTAIIYLFYISSIFSYITVRSAIKSILRGSVGARQKYSKLIKDQPLIERILLRYVKTYINRYHRTYNILMILNYIYMGLILSSLILIPIFYIYNLNLSDVLIAKVIILDLPIGVFSLSNTKSPLKQSRGGKEWKFEQKN
jgi:hypothetical protein